MRLLSLALLTLLVAPTAVFAQPPPPPPPPGYGPAPGYGPQPGYGQPQNLKQGLTFEANLGLGFIWAEADGQETDKEVALGGLNIGLGGWISPQLAISLRIAGVTYSEDVGDQTARLSTGFFGPSAQYWVNENAWIGGGIGMGFVAVSFDGDTESETGIGFDLRGGYTFSTTSENTWNISLELTPSSIEDVNFYGFGILFGYQHL